MNTLRKSCLAFLVTVLLSFSAHTTPVFASGLKLIQNGDTYYLSTTEDGSGTTTYKVVADTATSSATATASGTEVGNGVFKTPIDPPTGYTENIGQLINFILQLVIVLGLLLVFFNLIMAGLQWITSGGDKGKTDAARQRIIAALVGILVLSAAYAVAQLVAYVLGFDSFNEIFTTIKRINP